MSARVIDTIMAFPLFVLAMGIVAVLGNTVQNILYATAIINLPFYARLARAEISLRREAGFVEAARLSGNCDARILAVHLFPTVLPTMMVQISLNMGWSILNAARLSFIGLGQTPVVAVSYFAVSLILISYAKFSTATTKAPADTAERAPAGLPEPAV